MGQFEICYFIFLSVVFYGTSCMLAKILMNDGFGTELYLIVFWPLVLIKFLLKSAWRWSGYFLRGLCLILFTGWTD